jgi:phosphatidylserine decarboxylase
MTMRAALAKVFQQEEINFLLTNRIPRQLANRLFARISRIEQPLFARTAIAIWRLFADLDLSESPTDRFTSVHACFTRTLRPGARPIDDDPRVIVSPCDAIVGACGAVSHDELIQAKGCSYTLQDLLVDPRRAAYYIDGQFVTLRLTASMYHRFHAPHDCTIAQVTYISGDTWNVNPIALTRIAKLFCRNERAVIPAILRPGGIVITIVPVAAILVASIRLHFVDVLPSLRYRGTSEIACDARLAKGEEMGWFEHGSTIIVLAPKGVALCDAIAEGAVIRMGQPLMRMP